MEKEILIAGGTGLVGSNLTFKLLQLGWPVVSTIFRNSNPIFSEICVKYDFLDFEQCLEATRNKQSVVLCATATYGVKKNIENPTSSILPNLKIAVGLLDASARNKVNTIIIISSTTLYQPAFYPIREDALDLNIPPYHSYSEVGWYNRYLEQLASLYAKTYGMRIIIFRPTSLYGPYDKFGHENSNVIPALIKRALNEEAPFPVWGSPHVVRDFLYVEDFIDDITYALTHKDIPSNTPFNICNGGPLSIGDAAGIILKVCGHDAEVTFDADKPSSIPYRVVDDTKYRCYFGYKNRTLFELGIKKTVDWYKKSIKKEGDQ